MREEFVRTELLLGSGNMEKLYQSRVAVFGAGGVGGFVNEALARCGIGQLDIIDDDTVCMSNINRQIIALHHTVGRPKVDVMAERINDISSSIKVRKHKVFVSPSTIDSFDWEKFDYVVDAIDTVSAKLLLVEYANRFNLKIISCMGVGNKLHPELLEITDIYKTSMCPLAKVMRKELKARRVKKLKVLYSKEKPLSYHPEAAPECAQDKGTGETTVRSGSPKRYTPGSISFVPSAAGLIIGGEVIRTLLGIS